MACQSESKKLSLPSERLICLVLASIPFAFLVSMAVRYKVDVPFWDHWEFVPLIQKSYQGTLSFYDLWAQHNEHRLLFPKIIMLILARISGWNTSYELATSLFFGIGILATFVYQVRITFRSTGRRSIAWLVPIVSLIVFSLGQSQNWLWGWQLQMFLNVLAAMISIVLLADPVFKWPRFLLSLFFGVIATYSFANGILCWPIGILILLLVSDNKKLSVPAWGIAGCLVALSYLYGYHQPGHHPSLWLVFERPLEYVKYVLIYLGNPVVVFNRGLAPIAALFGLVAWIAAIGVLIHRRYRFSVLIPYIALSLYALGSALVTGLGRVGFGSEKAFESRYITLASLLWLSNVVLWYLLIGTNSEHKQYPQKRGVRYTAFLLLITLILLIAASSLHSKVEFENWYSYLSPTRDALLVMDGSPGNDDLLSRIYLVDVVKQRSEVLRQYQLSVFRPSVSLDVSFGDRLRLRGYKVEYEPLAVTLILYWEAPRTPDFDYSVFVHLVDGTGELIGQQDHAPGNNRHHPPTTWRPGEVIVDAHRISLPRDLQGTFQMRVGVYNWSNGERLPAFVDGNPVGDSIALKTGSPASPIVSVIVVGGASVAIVAGIVFLSVRRSRLSTWHSRISPTTEVVPPSFES